MRVIYTLLLLSFAFSVVAQTEYKLTSDGRRVPCPAQELAALQAKRPSAEQQLATNKAQAIAAIDARTDALIEEGFELAGGEAFPLSRREQILWVGRALAAALGQDVSGKKTKRKGKGSKAFASNNEFLQAFAQGMAQVEATAAQGIGLKEAVENAADTAAFDAVKKSAAWSDHFGE